jgi:hypothetical protein
MVIASADEPGTYFDDNTTFLTPHVLSGEVTDPLIAAGLNALLMGGSRAFEEPANDVSGLTVTPILASGYKSYLRDIFDGNNGTAQLDTDPVGPFSLALLGTRTQADGTLSRAFILGSSVVPTLSQLYESWNNLEFTLRFCEYLLNQKPVSLDIIAKPYMRPGLKEESRAVGGAAAVALPLMVLVLALFILLPRRHR